MLEIDPVDDRPDALNAFEGRASSSSCNRLVLEELGEVWYVHMTDLGEIGG